MTNHTPNVTDARLGTEVLPEGDRQALNEDLPGPTGPHPSAVDRLKRWFSFPVFLGAILVATNFAIELDK
jgi:hypothetical protein